MNSSTKANGWPTASAAADATSRCTTPCQRTKRTHSRASAKATRWSEETSSTSRPTSSRPPSTRFCIAWCSKRRASGDGSLRAARTLMRRSAGKSSSWAAATWRASEARADGPSNSTNSWTAHCSSIATWTLKESTLQGPGGPAPAKGSGQRVAETAVTTAGSRRRRRWWRTRRTSGSRMARTRRTARARTGAIRGTATRTGSPSRAEDIRRRVRRRWRLSCGATRTCSTCS
mmetsp:Transcript_14447/g.40925  ORF Transcript_14447/g.40925 Transcript_14447/m.40925 type:complete len:232 (-) Transcript_14447:901-1596(-)